MPSHSTEDVPAARSPRRVVLVSLNWTRDKDPRVPLGHASLVAALQSAGVDVRALSFPINQAGFREAQVLEALQESTRGLSSEHVDVGFGVYVWNDRAVRRLLVALRRQGFGGRIFLGGPQISYSGSGLERLYPEADAFVRGYGEEALVALAATPECLPLPGVHWAGQADLRAAGERDEAVRALGRGGHRRAGPPLQPGRALAHGAEDSAATRSTSGTGGGWRVLRKRYTGPRAATPEASRHWKRRWHPLRSWQACGLPRRRPCLA